MFGQRPRNPIASRRVSPAVETIAATSAVDSSRASTTRSAPARRRNATVIPLNAEKRVLACSAGRRNFASRRASRSERSETITPRTPIRPSSAAVSTNRGIIPSGIGEAFSATWTGASRAAAAWTRASSSSNEPTFASSKLLRLQETTGPNASDQNGGT